MSRQPPTQPYDTHSYQPNPSPSPSIHYRDRDDTYTGYRDRNSPQGGVQGYSTTSAPPASDERRPLLNPRLPSNPNGAPADPNVTRKRAVARRRKGILAAVLTFLFILSLVLTFFFYHDGMVLGSDPVEAAKRILDRAPIIDGHIDLPILIRARYSNNVSSFDLNQRMPGHVDIPRLKEGKVGGFFWSVYVECKYEGPWFIKPSYRVRDTLEQIDVARDMIESYPETFQFATSPSEVRFAIAKGKIASLLGVEGAHQLGNSLSVLRQYHALGVRYVTLTHSCHNAFADSGGMTIAPEPLHGGLSTIGRELVYELVRLGMLIDLSHTSDETASQAIDLAQKYGAPVFWSHSCARALNDISRNVPDGLLRRIGMDEDKVDGVVMLNFAPFFLAPEGEGADVRKAADHVEHIANITGKKHVGIGSDFDGIGSVPEGLEDVSKYPNLVAELFRRGWSRYDIAGLAGGNFLRVFDKADAIGWRLRREGAKPSYEIYKWRTDLPMGWDSTSQGHGSDEL